MSAFSFACVVSSSVRASDSLSNTKASCSLQQSSAMKLKTERKAILRGDRVFRYRVSFKIELEKRHTEFHARKQLFQCTCTATPAQAFEGKGATVDLGTFDWKKLQNGSDIRGVAVDGLKGQPINLHDEVVAAITSAFAHWLAEKKGLKSSEGLRIGVGRDSRISGPRIRDAAVRGLRSCGCEVFDFGIASTPAMFMSTVSPGYEYDGAMMLTASHLPFNRNGLKFFTADGGLEKADISAVLSLAPALAEQASAGSLDSTRVDFMSVYSQQLVDKIREGVNHPEHKDTPLEGFRIVVDAGNGAGGFFVDKVLKPLGADTTGSQFLDPDGMFPNHIPNPEDETAMRAIQKAVLDNNADLGVIFDTDVDRGGAVAQDGQEINRNRLIALLAAIIIGEHPGTTIVTDSVTSQGLAEFINSLGGVHHRFKRGYKNVISEAVRLNASGQDCQLAIETSGHGAVKENYFLDDGAYLIVKIIIQMARMKLQGEGDISALIKSLKEPVESAECRLGVNSDQFAPYAQQVLKDLAEYASTVPGWSPVQPNYEGVRVTVRGTGWFLVRSSLHDPLLPCNIESDVPGGVSSIAKQLLPFLQKYPLLDLTSLVKAAS